MPLPRKLLLLPKRSAIGFALTTGVRYLKCKNKPTQDMNEKQKTESGRIDSRTPPPHSYAYIPPSIHQSIHYLPTFYILCHMAYWGLSPAQVGQRQRIHPVQVGSPQATHTIHSFTPRVNLESPINFTAGRIKPMHKQVNNKSRARRAARKQEKRDVIGGSNALKGIKTGVHSEQGRSNKNTLFSEQH